MQKDDFLLEVCYANRMVKNSFFPLLIIGLLLSASFGLVLMNHIGEQGHSQCPFEAAGVGDCAQFQNPINFAASHLNTLSKLFSAIPVDGFAVSLSLLLTAIFAIFVAFNKKQELSELQPAFVQRRFRESFIPLNKITFIRWFALRENSPTSV